MSYLAACGHRKITFIGDSSDKQLGFTRGVLEKRLDYHENYVIATNEGEPFPEQRVAALLANSLRPTAFIVDSQSYAFELIKLLKKLKVRIPDDYSLIVYDDIPEMERMEIPLTTVGPLIKKLASTAMEIISDKSWLGSKAWADIEIKCELIVRKSTRQIEVIP
ncbi:HTH-type transcriptional repressor PurR [compost metagenome]